MLRPDPADLPTARGQSHYQGVGILALKAAVSNWTQGGLRKIPAACGVSS